ncbi:MAG TPA: sigma-70 family RNA polymerase sigma factor [Bryobacteraceae bacterium]|nr:sigma-70 family RNA polymerase sigma factor [Bryobacteraceae bacterium]
MHDFEQIVEKNQEMVFRTLARLTGERAGLEDMAQEVFLRLFGALPHFRGEAQLTTFLYRIIVNVANDEFSARQKARLTTPIQDREARWLAHSSASPAVLVERMQMQEAVDAALRRLTPRDRTILTLHYQEGRGYEEIAAILDLPMGTVKTHLHCARERLRNMMKEKAE